MNILTLNKIAACGTDLFDDKYTVGEDVQNPDGIMVRSAAMHDMELPESVLAIARAGAGVNNIPVDKCGEAGIVVFNTPPCYSIYVAKLVLEWLKNDIGGLENMQKINEKKAKILYDFLDESKMFRGTVVKEDRSLMNVPFVTDDEDLNAKFIKEAADAGFVNLKGHRSVGGMRASIYNAMPVEGVEKLVRFMREFEAANS